MSGKALAAGVFVMSVEEPAASASPLMGSLISGPKVERAVDPRNNLAHCFSCRQNLNNIDLLIRLGYDFVSAVAVLEHWLTQHQARQGRQKPLASPPAT